MRDMAPFSWVRCAGFARNKTHPAASKKAVEKLIIAGENINIEKFIKKEKIEVISSAIHELGGETLKPIKEKLGDNFSYGEIRLVRAAILPLSLPLIHFF